MHRRFVPWMLVAGLLTGLCLLMGILFQQVYRMSANDPQIQIAKDFSQSSVQNQFTDETLRSSFDSFTPVNRQVNIETSLSPWIQVYSETGENIFSSAIISGAQSTPKIPKGLFKEVDKHGEVRVTWQPNKHTRQAIVITKFTGLKNGYFVAGRSLSETERRIGNMMWMIGGMWSVMMIGIVVTALWHLGYLPEWKKTRV